MRNERRLCWDDSSGRITIAFPYDLALIDLVRDLPGRRWDRDRKVWLAPIESALEVIRVLEPRGFVVEPELAKRISRNDPTEAEFFGDPIDPVDEPPPLELLEGDWSYGGEAGPSAARDPIAPSAPPPAPESPAGAGPTSPRADRPAHLTVSELNRSVKEALKNRFPAAIWVVGQVSGWDRNAHKEHVFFELSERDRAGEKDLARVTAGLFGGMRSRVVRRLSEVEPRVEIQDGVQVRLRVRVDVYARSGSYQVVVEDIDPDFTLGAIAMQREKILAELDRRGLVSKNLGLPEPGLPLRIALITSWGSDAANDVAAELTRSGFSFAVEVFDCFMQGPRLEDSVCAALGRIASTAADYDLCLICRGGGSRTDLAWFDNLNVAIAVAKLPLKVVVGIGHHRDLSALDFIAHSEKTPTAAAGRLVAILATRETELEDAARDLIRLSGERLRSARLDLSHAGARYRRAAVVSTRLAAQIVSSAQARLLQAVRQAMVRSGAALAESAATASFLARGSIREEKRSLERLSLQLAERSKRALGLEKERLVASGREIGAQDPRRLLGRGFAILRRADDRHVITGIHGTEAGESISVELRDGELDALVETVREKQVSERSEGERK